MVLVIIIGGLFYFYHKINYSKGLASQPKIMEIEKGDNFLEVGSKLKEQNLISERVYFVYYMWSRDMGDKIMAGKYEINPQFTIPEIARIITEGEVFSNQVKITFPEGWASKEMGLRIKNNGLDNENSFSELVKDAEYFKNEYGYKFLDDVPRGKGLEGFLFPDTYFFSKDATSEAIIKKMLDNFDSKLTDELRKEIESQDKDVYEILTMASVIENEVRSEEDRKIASDIFWGRISIGQPLQSCATLAYILGVNKKQYSFEDTRVDSPYNTYLNKGLPPSPISNPGIVSIKAAIYPTKTNYNYFLSDPATGKTIFSSTIEEHNANKVKYGL